MYRIENTRATILRVQSMLRTISYNDPVYPHVPKDGIYGTETAEAVVLFQKNNELEATGRVDYLTFVALRDTRDAIPTETESSVLSFPLERGRQGEDVSLLHSLLQKFDRLHPNLFVVPTGSYYSERSEEAVRSIARFFLQHDEGKMTERLYRHMLAYLHAYGHAPIGHRGE